MLNAEFADTGELATAFPAHVPPVRAGGVGVAAIGTSFVFRGVRRSVRDHGAFRKAKFVAVCLGHARPGSSELEPCTLTAATVEELAALHPSEATLRGKPGQGGEQVVLALFSDDKLDDEKFTLAKKDHEERRKALEETKSHVERQAMLSQWRTEGLPDPRRAFPEPQIVGLLSDSIRPTN